MSSVFVKNNRYGKTKVRLAKLTRLDAQHHTIKDLNVECLLFGSKFVPSYSEADNRLVIPTDTVKNTIYVLGMKNPIESIETFGILLAKHFIEKYSHVEGVNVTIEEAIWAPMNVSSSNNPHPHSYVRSSNEVRFAKVNGNRNGEWSLSGGIKDLVVLKTTGSGFEDFHRCEYTVLKDARDRILSTSVLCEWTYNHAQSISAADFNKTYESCRQIILDTFALEYSPGVQATLYTIGKRIIAKNERVEEVRMSLPNIHYFTIDLSPFGIDNKNTLFRPFSDPSGLIEATIARQRAKL